MSTKEDAPRSFTTRGISGEAPAAPAAGQDQGGLGVDLTSFGTDHGDFDGIGVVDDLSKLTPEQLADRMEPCRSGRHMKTTNQGTRCEVCHHEIPLEELPIHVFVQWGAVEPLLEILAEATPALVERFTEAQALAMNPGPDIDERKEEATKMLDRLELVQAVTAQISQGIAERATQVRERQAAAEEAAEAETKKS